MFAIRRSGGHLNTKFRIIQQSASKCRAKALTSPFRARILGRWRSASVIRRLLYNSKSIPPGRSGAAIDLTPRALGWRRIHFAVRQLAAGAVWSTMSRREERCLVLLRGRAAVDCGGRSWRVGPRPDVFDAYPHAVYVPAGVAVRVTAEVVSEIADCRAIARRAAPRAPALDARVIRPEDCGYEIRGGGNATRQIVDILPPSALADRLMICEVYTPSGNWSSYPPHKHDVDDPPREVDLEEIYYYRFRDPAAYGFQRLYSRRSDATLRVAHGDVVPVRHGYHPFVTAYGYDAYYLNVLAGERRSMAASDDPQYAHFRRQWPAPDPRLPLVAPPAARLSTLHSGGAS
jgi:5-deoxy-glucuronate isomerase